MLSRILQVAYNSSLELAGYFIQLSLLKEVILITITLAFLYKAPKLYRKRYLSRELKNLKLANRNGKLKFIETKKKVDFKKYNTEMSNPQWWKDHLGDLESIFGEQFLSIESTSYRFKQNKITLIKDILPSSHKSVIKNLKPFEFNAGLDQKKEKLIHSIKDKCGIGYFMQTNQGKTTLFCTNAIDLIHSFRDFECKPVFIISAPKDQGADFLGFKKIYSNTEIYDTSRIDQLEKFINRFEEIIKIMDDAQEKALKNNIVVNHNIKLPNEYLYTPFFIVLDEVFQILKTKNVSPERKVLHLRLQRLLDVAIRQWRTKLSKIFIMSQDYTASDLEGIAHQNIHIKYFGTIKSTLKHTGALPSDEFYDRADFKQGKYLLIASGDHKIVRTPFYGPSDNLKPPFKGGF